MSWGHKYGTMWKVLSEGIHMCNTRGPKGHITCTWVQCATFLKDQPGWLFLFTDWPKKRKLGKGCWDLGSCQLPLNSVQWFWRKSRIISADARLGQPFCFSDQPEKHKLSRGCWDLASILTFVEFCSAVSEDRSKMSQPIRGQDGHFVFPIGPKNTNLVEDNEILLHIKFRWILFSGFRGEVENISANQRPGRPSCFSDRPEKHKLGRGCWDLALYQVSLNSVQRFQRRSRKYLSQSEARAAIFFFRSARKTQTW